MYFTKFSYRDRGEGGAGGTSAPSLFIADEDFFAATVNKLLTRSVNKSCEDTKTADESDAQIAGNGIKEVLNFKISQRQPSLKTWVDYVF